MMLGVNSWKCLSLRLLHAVAIVVKMWWQKCCDGATFATTCSFLQCCQPSHGSGQPVPLEKWQPICFHCVKNGQRKSPADFSLLSFSFLVFVKLALCVWNWCNVGIVFFLFAACHFPKWRKSCCHAAADQLQAMQLAHVWQLWFWKSVLKDILYGKGMLQCTLLLHRERHWWRGVQK